MKPSFDRQERMTLLRDEEGYALDTADKKRYRFQPFNGNAEQQYWYRLRK